MSSRPPFSPAAQTIFRETLRAPPGCAAIADISPSGSGSVTPSVVSSSASPQRRSAEITSGSTGPDLFPRWFHSAWRQRLHGPGYARRSEAAWALARLGQPGTAVLDEAAGSADAEIRRLAFLELVDERLTSHEAEGLLRASGARGARLKAGLDPVAAQRILESFFASANL